MVRWVCNSFCWLLLVSGEEELLLVFGWWLFVGKFGRRWFFSSGIKALEAGWCFVDELVLSGAFMDSGPWSKKNERGRLFFLFLVHKIFFLMVFYCFVFFFFVCVFSRGSHQSLLSFFPHILSQNFLLIFPLEFSLPLHSETKPLYLLFSNLFDFQFLIFK